MKDIGAFVLALLRHWVGLVASGLLAVALTVLPAWDIAVPKPVVQAAVIFFLIVAAFGAWKDERRAAEARASELAEAKATIERLKEENGVAFEVSDPEYWLLMTAAKYGLRRDVIANNRYGATADVLFLGDTPIDYGDSRWLYSIVDDLIRRGAIRIEDSTIRRIHRVTDEGNQAIRAGQKRERKVQIPEMQLIDARNGSVVTLPP